jgi:hypothetical protein
MNAIDDSYLLRSSYPVHWSADSILAMWCDLMAKMLNEPQEYPPVAKLSTKPTRKSRKGFDDIAMVLTQTPEDGLDETGFETKPIARVISARAKPNRRASRP